LTVGRLKLTFRIEGNQNLTGFLFLILKNSFSMRPTPERAARYAGDGGGNSILASTPADPMKIEYPVNNSVRGASFLIATLFREEGKTAWQNAASHLAPMYPMIEFQGFSLERQFHWFGRNNRFAYV
jgi:hypothetical protein